MRRRMMFGVSLSGAGIPSDGLGGLGNRYFDTTAQRWYLKRWVGNFNADKAELPVQIFGGIGDWEIELLVKTSTIIADSRFVSSRSTLSANATVISGQSTGSSIGADAYGVGYLARVTNVHDGVWHKLRFTKVGNLYSSWKDGVAGSTSINSSAISADSFIVGGGGLNMPAISMLANIKAAGYGKKLLWEFSDGSGTVATDSSGYGLDGVITDNAPAGFWSQSWVPMDLL